MNERIKRLKSRLTPNKYPICIEKIKFITESLQQTEGEPAILRRAKAIAHYLDNRSIFIEDDELIIGNAAAIPNGLEADAPTWRDNEFSDLRAGGVIISDEDIAFLKSLDEYWKDKGKFLWERTGQFYDIDRLGAFVQKGIILPPIKNFKEGFGYGAAGGGWNLGLGITLFVADYEQVLNLGTKKIIDDAREELNKLRFTNSDAVKKADFLKSVIIAHEALVRIAKRYANLALKMASEEKEPKRKAELELIAKTCNWVPYNPARSFREAMQSFWFIFLAITGGPYLGVASGGRFDQFMYPFYKEDKDKGDINDAETLELLECLRIKVMQINMTMGNKGQREKWAGMARWNNWIIGGLTADGKDASNELSYLILDAAEECRTPHHTITLRVNENTPDELMLKALEVVKTGIGMPAFVGDKSYIGFLTGEGVSIKDARNYALAGCLDANIPGKSRIGAIQMFVVPLVFELAMYNGIDRETGKQLGLRTGEFEDFQNFDEFMNAFKKQLAYFLGIAAEQQNIILQAQTELTPDPYCSSLMEDAIKVGKDVLERTMTFENGSTLNAIGMINVVDSMAVIKKLVFEDKKITKQDLKQALIANWQGPKYQEIRKMCLDIPKYGNGLIYVDSIAKELYKFWVDTIKTFTTAWGGTMKPSGVSITAYGPGGALTGATPDGRFAGENLADGTMSSAQGKDTHGPTALLRSAMTVDQIPFGSTLLNVKFHDSALATTEDLNKLASLIKTYFNMGGKHIQFNVVNKETLVDAQKNPENYGDLIVRVAGYSAYFVQLSKDIQEDIISRTEHELV